jgi:hypothetical protein
MSSACASLGRDDILRMQANGTTFFSDGAVRVANGWMMLTLDSRLNYGVELVADPDKEPDKWRDDHGPRLEEEQLSLL